MVSGFPLRRSTLTTMICVKRDSPFPLKTKLDLALNLTVFDLKQKESKVIVSEKEQLGLHLSTHRIVKFSESGYRQEISHTDAIGKEKSYKINTI